MAEGPAHDDEFYVGYLPAPPPRIGRCTRRAVLVLATVVLTVPLAVVLGRAPLPPASFEFGHERRFRGTIHAAPFPTLEIPRPGAAEAAQAADGVTRSSLLLVAPGKHGAAELARRFDGKAVELHGTLIYRGGHTMIEVTPESVAEAAHDAPVRDALPVVDLGRVRLEGEIVDTKCHLGVMNPGDGKTHRDCAARCISGGVPPALRVREGDGSQRLLLLVGPAGEPVNVALLPYVAEPVAIEGRAERRGDLLVLYADPAAIRRVGEEG